MRPCVDNAAFAVASIDAVTSSTERELRIEVIVINVSDVGVLAGAALLILVRPG